MTSLRGFTLGLGLAVGIAVPAMALPITIDFEGSSPGLIPGGALVVNVGAVNVTFSGTGLQFVQFSSPFPNHVVLTTDPTSPEITITLSASAKFTSAEIDNLIRGEFTSESDRIIVSAFNGVPSLIGSTTGTGAIVHVDAPNAIRVTVDDVPGPTGTPGVDFAGFTIDAFRFELVPEPASMAVLVVGLVALAARRRR